MFYKKVYEALGRSSIGFSSVTEHRMNNDSVGIRVTNAILAGSMTLAVALLMYLIAQVKELENTTVSLQIKMADIQAKMSEMQRQADAESLRRRMEGR